MGALGQGPLAPTLSRRAGEDFPIDSVFPAARAAEALTRMREKRNAGQILLDWA